MTPAHAIFPHGIDSNLQIGAPPRKVARMKPKTYLRVHRLSPICTIKPWGVGYFAGERPIVFDRAAWQ